MSTWNWIQLAVAVLAAIAAAVGKNLSKWLGLAMGVAAGGLMIGMSIYSHDMRFLGFGILAILVAPIAIIANAVSQPDAQDDTLGAQITNLPPWAMIVIGVLFVGAIIPCFVLKAPLVAGSQAPPQSEQTESLRKGASSKTSKPGTSKPAPHK